MMRRLWNAAAAALQRRDVGYQIGLIGFCQLSNLLRLAHYLVHVHPRYLPRLGTVVLTSACSAPLRAWEKVRYGRALAKVPVEPPVFILGHWRSGTTYLHNLMTQDPSFGYVSMYQAMVPNCSLVGGRWLKALLGSVLPRKRPMDNLEWPVDAPQEEELPLAKVLPHGFYALFLFPRMLELFFRRDVLLLGATPRAVDELKRKYLGVLKVATLHAGGRRLVLKNPVNTARVRLLLEMFPEARFIHIHRHPYDVFASTCHLRRKLLRLTTVQKTDDANLGPSVLYIYEQMMRRYLDERALIPPGNIVDVRYEDLEREPLHVLRRIYDTLGLSGFTAAAPAFHAHVASQRAYQKNRLEISEADKRRVEERWAFAFDALGYEMDVPVRPAAVAVR